ncbi:hypothetical protein BJ085DRAFT_37602 [Dimargaris cristalligena]|uniref:Uncharacterized protein n=1 Tax=Dimargaris cristalligena TaxID=215637 RepID=A0A4Q0A2Z3_9FUNG|nr:hypothetical protein BJ085DRAFT_37602 [Dimargaris cristalligena]|eukprot:RKP40218.1 hypothetical protein BJ085DRAFT_37602 [Dimargaris cristalligena]
MDLPASLSPSPEPKHDDDHMLDDGFAPTYQVSPVSQPLASSTLPRHPADTPSAAGSGAHRASLASQARNVNAWPHEEVVMVLEEVTKPEELELFKQGKKGQALKNVYDLLPHRSRSAVHNKLRQLDRNYKELVEQTKTRQWKVRVQGLTPEQIHDKLVQEFRYWDYLDKIITMSDDEAANLVDKPHHGGGHHHHQHHASGAGDPFSTTPTSAHHPHHSRYSDNYDMDDEDGMTASLHLSDSEPEDSHSASNGRYHSATYVSATAAPGASTSGIHQIQHHNHHPDHPAEEHSYDPSAGPSVRSPLHPAYASDGHHVPSAHHSTLPNPAMAHSNSNHSNHSPNNNATTTTPNNNHHLLNSATPNNHHHHHPPSTQSNGQRPPIATLNTTPASARKRNRPSASSLAVTAGRERDRNTLKRPRPSTTTATTTTTTGPSAHAHSSHPLPPLSATAAAPINVTQEFALSPLPAEILQKPDMYLAARKLELEMLQVRHQIMQDQERAVLDRKKFEFEREQAHYLRKNEAHRLNMEKQHNDLMLIEAKSKTTALQWRIRSQNADYDSASDRE